MVSISRLVLPAVLIAASACAQAQPDNVLVIVADDLGVDYVEAYGEGTSPPPTPTLTALAQRGVLFRNAWANPSCSPTRACILTGRYPFRTLVGRWIRHPNNSEPIGTLAPEEWTLPEVLDGAGSGYAHACIGKWHVHDVSHGLDAPRALGGFSHFAGSLEGQIPSYTSWTRVVDGVAGTTTRYCTTQNTDDALTWIRAQAGPWFCVLTYQAPHIPYHAPPAHLHTQNLAGLTPSSGHTPANRPFYRAMVESLDTEIGRLLASLGSAVVDRTNVVFIGDNGSVQQQAVAPFDRNRAKGTPYEGGVNVPLIVAGPAIAQPGREVTALVDSVDVFATALELAGVDARSIVPRWLDLDAVSVGPYLRDPAQPALRAFSYTEEFNGDEWPRPNQNGHATVRNARYKLIHRYGGGSHELFDLQLDPFETSNLLSRSLTNGEQQALGELQGVIGTLRGQPARFETFGGGGCASAAGPVPVQLMVGSSRLGQSYTSQLQAAPASTTVFHLVGFAADCWQGIPLPVDLGLIGAAAGCELSVAGHVVIARSTDASGFAVAGLTVPFDYGLVGLVVFHQWLVADAPTPANPLGLVPTGAAAAVVGL